jgi:hypothetical protein
MTDPEADTELTLEDTERLRAAIGRSRQFVFSWPQRIGQICATDYLLCFTFSLPQRNIVQELSARDYASISAFCEQFFTLLNEHPDIRNSSLYKITLNCLVV